MSQKRPPFVRKNGLTSIAVSLFTLTSTACLKPHCHTTSLIRPPVSDNHQYNPFNSKHILQYQVSADKKE